MPTVALPEDVVPRRPRGRPCRRSYPHRLRRAGRREARGKGHHPRRRPAHRRQRRPQHRHPVQGRLYAKLRPTLKLPADQLKKINDELGLHPSLDGLADLLEDRSLCVVQGVGYPNPTQSHFRSMDIWQAASTAETLTEGWVGKALKAMNVAARSTSPAATRRRRWR